MPDAIWLLAILIGIPAVLAYLERPRRGLRYSGKIYDPQLRARVQSQADKSGMRATHAVEAALRVGNTGRVCVACGATTFGYSPRCGRCGFENTSLTTQARPSLLASEASSLLTPDHASPRHDPVATAHQLPASSLSPVPAPAPRGTRRRGGGVVS